jgi:O-antigen ligase
MLLGRVQSCDGTSEANIHALAARRRDFGSRVTCVASELVRNSRLIALRGALPSIADWSAIAVAASLPWSTSATSILVVCWLICLLPTLRLAPLRREILTPAGGLPVLLWLLAAAGMLWADVAWAERFDGLDGFLKLLAIPFLLAHFRHSERAACVLMAFLLSCTLLLVTSYFLALWPGLPWRGVRAGLGVPVKDYIAQSGEFAICVFILLAIALSLARTRSWGGLWILLWATLFLINFLYLATGRTALAVTVVLLLTFALRQFGLKKGGLALLAAMLLGAAIWESSPFLRGRVGVVPGEVERYWNENASTPSGERLEYWKRSVSFMADAPVLGHGTGTIRELFRRSAVGQTGASAEVSPNPHNQTLAIGIQLGTTGVVLLYAMWIAHLLLFRGPGLPAWIGLVFVIQNIVSSLFNSHLFDFTQGWIYVFGVGVAGGAVLRQAAKKTEAMDSASVPIASA